jgi:hypothetical protein
MMTITSAPACDFVRNTPVSAIRHDSQQDTPAPAETHDSEPACKGYLWNWGEILHALGLPNDAKHQRRVRDANKRFDGTIILPAKGGQPEVSKDCLLSWWNSLEDRFRELRQLQIDRGATVAPSFSFGRDATIVPGISGHVRKRRKRSKNI